MKDTKILPLTSRLVFDVKILFHKLDSSTDPGIYNKAKAIVANDKLSEITDIRE